MAVLDVLYHGRLVGKLGQNERGLIVFTYGAEWLRDGFSIAPYSLPLKADLFTADPMKFGGLFGVFADSLPDGWGTLLATKTLRKKGIDYRSLSPLEKLRYVGADGLGALTYRPSVAFARANDDGDYDAIALSMMAFREDKKTDLDALFAMGGSSGGARPKAHLMIDGEEWIVKFRERNDPIDIGRMEYECSLSAAEAGIHVPETRLLPSKLCEGYFAAKRFDRGKSGRVHVLSLSALLETPHDRPVLDYVTFLQATGFITQSAQEVLKAFGRACFNVLAHNADDHAKNFGFVYDEGCKAYRLSPAYDLTVIGPMREHEMTCMGNGNPGEEDLRALYRKMNLPTEACESIIQRTKTSIVKHLSPWMGEIRP